MRQNRQKQDDLFSRKSIRCALRLWHRPRKLGEHPLAGLKIVVARRRATAWASPAASVGLALRDVLSDALERLKPDEEAPDFREAAWCPYLILKEQYVNGRNRDYIIEQLQPITSHRTFHRVQNKALGQLADTLRRWEEGAGGMATAADRQAPFLAPPKHPHRLVGRYPFLHELKGRLFADGCLALYGLPGVGKTALAIELAHDPEALAHFGDGVLWAGLGREPDALALLGTWGAALGIPAGELARQTTTAGRAKALHNAMGMRRLLLVIDDAWALEAALAFRVGGPHCACLLTTRLPHIARDFAEERAITVNELSDAGGLLLFRQLAPAVAEAEPDEAQELVRAVGGLPLALILMAQYARHAAGQGARPLRSALARLRQAKERQKLEMPQVLAAGHPSLPPGTPLSLSAAIEISDSALDEASRQAFYALSVFPPKPSAFSQEAALAVCSAPAATLDALANHGLLETRGPDRYTLHQAIADYARLRYAAGGLGPETGPSERGTSPGAKTAYGRMVAFFVGYVEAHGAEYDDLDVEMFNILAALQLAFEHDMPAALTRGANAFYPFWEARGLYALAETHLRRAEQAARAIEDTDGLAITLLNSGKIAEKRGDYVQAKAHFQAGLEVARARGHTNTAVALLMNLGLVTTYQGAYDQAEAHYREGLALARESGHRESISAILGNLGILAKNRGAYDQAKAYYQESLALARELGHQDKVSRNLTNLGILAFNRGDYDQAEAYYQEGLALARELGHRETIGSLLTNLGALAASRRAFDEAESYFQEGLALARESGYRERISNLLVNLGEVARERGATNRADAYFQESLALARELGHHWLISGILAEWGELHLRQHRWDLAAAAFDEALEIAQEAGIHEFAAKAWYGSAQVALAQDKVAEARRQGQESLALFEGIGHKDTAVVQAWLAGLPET